jgi:methyl-accepting chemotaxis protein
MADAYKRKRYFIQKGFQSKMIRNVLLLVIIGTVITGAIVYGIVAYQQKMAKAELFAVTDTFGDDPKIITRIQIVKPAIISSLIITNVISLIVVSVLMLFYSHRIAGPVYKIQKAMGQVQDGHFGLDISLRIKDEFQELADSFNLMLDGLRKKVLEAKISQNDVHAALDTLIDEKVISKDDCKHLMDNIENSESVLDTFKTAS